MSISKHHEESNQSLPAGGRIVHADHGTRFTSWLFGAKIRSAGLPPSFGTVGDGLDNAMMESFWSSMQIELLNRKKWKTRVELANAIFEYIEIFHNRQRRHSALGYRTPIEHETPNINSIPADSRVHIATRHAGHVGWAAESRGSTGASVRRQLAIHLPCGPGEGMRKPGPGFGPDRASIRVDLPRRFSNPRPALKSLISRVLKGSRGGTIRSRSVDRQDTRGPVQNNRLKSQTRLKPEQRARLLADYEAGLSVRAISAKYGVHRGTIPNLVRRAGGTLREPGLSQADQVRAARLYSEGLTLTQVARRLDSSDESVRRAVILEGGQIRPKGRIPRASR